MNSIQGSAMRRAAASCAVLTGLVLASSAMADPVPFASTSDTSSWRVATNVGGADGQFSSFPTTGFTTATQIAGRMTDGVDWIANNASGTNGPIGTWTFFTFQQSFDLTGHDPSTATLQFKWAADDSGQIFSERGSWVPKYSLNGGPLVAGTWTDAGGASYAFGDLTTVTSGFVSGINTIRFYVEGNGETDGFALTTAIPEPGTCATLLAGLAVLGWVGRRRQRDAA